MSNQLSAPHPSNLPPPHFTEPPEPPDFLRAEKSHHSDPTQYFSLGFSMRDRGVGIARGLGFLPVEVAARGDSEPERGESGERPEATAHDLHGNVGMRFVEGETGERWMA